MDRLVFSTTQIYNRRNLGFLYDKRAELDAGQFEIIKSIKNNKKKNGSMVPSQSITYKLSSENGGKLGYGRLYGSKGSFETLEKECRGTVCKEYYHDIDIVNCHPVLLLQFAKSKYNIELPEVEKYVSQREEYLKHVMEENSCTRDVAKQSLLSVLYGGTVNSKSCLYDLCQEVRGFSKKLYQVPEYADLAKAVKSKDNLYGSFLSFVLQTEERKCMLAMKEHMEGEGWSVDVLCYDGIMIRKREGFSPDLLKCQLSVKDVTGYDIDLVTKEFLSFDMPPISEEIVKGVSLDAYREMKEEFEKNHFYHLPSDKFVEVRDDASMIFMTLPHAHQVLNSKWCFKQSDKFGDSIPFLDIWKRDPTYKVCTETSFKETEDPEIFTLPLNLEFMKAKNFTESPRSLELFLELVNINTSGDDILQEYMLDYFAHMLQKPTELPGVALVITGAKGTGKDTMGDFLQKHVVGNHLCTNYSTNQQFFNKHDTGKLNKLLIKLEETSRKECFENASELKATITARQTTCNPKGIKEITSDNFARYIFTTNKANPVDMSDGERRFCLLPSSSRRKGDFAFWTEVREVLFSSNGGKTVADYLLARDISNFQVRKLPENNFQSSVVKSELSSEEKFIEQWEGLKTDASTLFDEYVQFCTTNHYPHATNAGWFGKNLQNFVRDGKLINTHSGHVSYYYKV